VQDPSSHEDRWQAIDPAELEKANEVGRQSWEFFECIAHIRPSPRGEAQTEIKIRGRLVDRTRPARFMPFKDGVIGDVLRPPSDGERVVLADVLEEDLAQVRRRRLDLLEFCRATGTGFSSWDAAIDVRMVALDTGESALGYFDRAEKQPDGRYRVGIFIPDVSKAESRGRIHVRTFLLQESE